jgi:hypothetical protein
LKPGWQDELGNIIDRETWSYERIAYGFLPAVLFLIPYIRKKRLEWFYKRWENAFNNYNVVPSIVAHSFGTHLVAGAMRKYPDMKFDRIVFCGSIVVTDFRWREIYERGQFKQLLNQYGGLDFWAGFVQWAVTDAGPSGKRGFDRSADIEGIVRQEEYPEWNHGNYFHKTNYQRWRSFVAGEELFPYKPVYGSKRTNYRPLFALFTLVIGLLRLFRWCSSNRREPIVVPTPAPTILPVSATATAIPTSTEIQRPSPAPRPSQNWIVTTAPTPTITQSPEATPSSANTPTPMGTLTPTPSATGSIDVSQAADALVEQGLIHLKDGHWSTAVQAFGQALKIQPTNDRASTALWNALLKHSGDRLDLPDRAYSWPKGARLVDLAPKDPVVLIQTKASVALYDYQSTKQISVPAENIPTVSFSNDGRYLLITWWVLTPGRKPDPTYGIASEKKFRLVSVSQLDIRETHALPTGWNPMEPGFWQHGNLLMINKPGEFRWWNPDTAAWANGPLKVPKVHSLQQIDQEGRYFVWSDSQNHAHIYDLLHQKDLLSGLPVQSIGVTLAGSGRVLVVPEPPSNIVLPQTLKDAFILWTIQWNKDGPVQPVRVNNDGDFLLEINRDDQISLCQREPQRSFRLPQLVKERRFPLPWRFHPERKELYFESAHSLCVYDLPTMPYFRSEEDLPAPPTLPPGATIHKFLQLARPPDDNKTEITLCTERDQLHSQLLQDDEKPSGEKQFKDLPEEWRKLLKWWTTKPGERKVWH